LATSCQLVASLVVFYIPLVHQVANMSASPKSCELVVTYLATSWKPRVANPGWQLVSN